MSEKEVLNKGSDRAVRIALFLLSVIAVPFVVTGFYRVLPEAWPLRIWAVIPFVLVGATAVALIVRGGRGRFVGWGFIAGSCLYATFLVWLFVQLGTQPEIP
jgi:hypothetical protein